MAEKVLATYVLDFGAGVSGSLTIAVNSDDNNGKTSFYPGDLIKLRVYAMPSSILDDITVSSTNGSLTTDAVTTDSFEEDVTFTNGQGSVSHTIEVANISWYGIDLGSISYQSGASSELNSQIAGMGIGKVTYTAKYVQINFMSVSDNFDPVLIWVESN